MIDLSPEQLALVRDVLGHHVPRCRVSAIGSRVRGTAKPYSDLDLLLDAGARIPLDTLGMLREAFQESTLPFRVDLVDARAASAEFLSMVDPQSELIRSADPM
jgi:uncharacterized protein